MIDEAGNCQTLDKTVTDCLHMLADYTNAISRLENIVRYARPERFVVISERLGGQGGVNCGKIE